MENHDKRLTEMKGKVMHFKFLLMIFITIILLLLILFSAIFKYRPQLFDPVRKRDRVTPREFRVDNYEPSAIIEEDILDLHEEELDDEMEVTPIAPTPPVIEELPTLIGLSLGDCTGWSELRSVPTDDQVVFLSFDAGSTKDALDNILVSLKRFDWRATFFMTGVWMARYTEETEQIANAGHDMYNHSYDHADFKTLNEQQMIDELVRTEDLLFELTGKSPKPFFRPPYGSRDQRVVSSVCRSGYYTIYWSYDTLDWKSGVGYSSSEMSSKLLASLEPGGIYLMHLGSVSTKESIDQIVQGISDQGYKVAPLSEYIEVVP